MSRFSLSVLCILLSTTVAGGQNSKAHFPKETQKLIDRAQEFWDGVVAGQRMKTLDLVLPDKRDAFIAGSPMPILAAKVVSIDVTEDVNRATVRVQVSMLSTEVASQQSFSMVSSFWVWQRNNWYADVGSVRDLLIATGGLAGATVEELKRDAEKLQLANSTMDIGRVAIRQNLEFEVPAVYEGKSIFDVESVLPLDFFGVAAGQAGLSSSRPKFLLFVHTQDLSGPFSIPLKLRFQIRNEAPSVERTLTVRGEVFAPLSFRRATSDNPGNPEDIVIFVKNNTEESVKIKSIICDAFDILKSPSVLAPGSEEEVLLHHRPGAIPDRLAVFPEQPVAGLGYFEYRFPPK